MVGEVGVGRVGMSCLLVFFLAGWWSRLRDEQLLTLVGEDTENTTLPITSALEQANDDAKNAPLLTLLTA